MDNRTRRSRAGGKLIQNTLSVFQRYNIVSDGDLFNVSP